MSKYGVYYTGQFSDTLKGTFPSDWAAKSARLDLVDAHHETTGQKKSILRRWYEVRPLGEDKPVKSASRSKTKLTPVREIPAHAVIIRAVHERGKSQKDALAELSRRGLWLSPDQKRQAGLTASELDQDLGIKPSGALLEQVEHMGAAAFHAGTKAAPALDRNLAPILKQGTGKGHAWHMDVLEAWSRGWHQANLDAPVPGWSDEENAALRRAREGGAPSMPPGTRKG